MKTKDKTILEVEAFKGKEILLVEDVELNREIAETILTEADIPIIAMTANAFEEDAKAAIEAGMNAHMAKPIRIESLYEIIEQYL